MKLQSGTYIREPDGVTLLYHSELTSWNMPDTALRHYLENKHMESFPEINKWRQVIDNQEFQELKDWIGDYLKPGESVIIRPHEMPTVEKYIG